MDTVTIKKRLEFHTKRLDNLYVAYNKLLSGGVKSFRPPAGVRYILEMHFDGFFPDRCRAMPLLCFYLMRRSSSDSISSLWSR